MCKSESMMKIAVLSYTANNGRSHRDHNMYGVTECVGEREERNKSKRERGITKEYRAARDQSVSMPSAWVHRWVVGHRWQGSGEGWVGCWVGVVWVGYWVGVA